MANEPIGKPIADSALFWGAVEGIYKGAQWRQAGADWPTAVGKGLRAGSSLALIYMCSFMAIVSGALLWASLTAPTSTMPDGTEVGGGSSSTIITWLCLVFFVPSVATIIYSLIIRSHDKAALIQQRIDQLQAEPIEVSEPIEVTATAPIRSTYKRTVRRRRELG